MAWPSDLARTKNWGTEILTDSDLEAQLDLIINWVAAAFDQNSGHGHEGTANKSKKIDPSSGMKIGSQAQGDVLYADSANTFARLGASTKGKCLTTGGAAANPTWEGMTTRGDVEYMGASNRSRLAAGSAGQALTTRGGSADPAFDGMTTSGDVEYHNGTTRTRLAKGSDGKSLVLASGLPAWGDPTIAASNVGTAAQANCGSGSWTTICTATVNEAEGVLQFDVFIDIDASFNAGSLKFQVLDNGGSAVSFQAIGNVFQNAATEAASSAGSGTEVTLLTYSGNNKKGSAAAVIKLKPGSTGTFTLQGQSTASITWDCCGLSDWSR